MKILDKSVCSALLVSASLVGGFANAESSDITSAEAAAAAGVSFSGSTTVPYIWANNVDELSEIPFGSLVVDGQIGVGEVVTTQFASVGVLFSIDPVQSGPCYSCFL